MVTTQTGAELLASCKEALNAAGEPEVELFARVRARGVARFSGGELGQHMDLDDPQAVVRVARGRRVAEVMTSRIDRDGLLDAIREASATAPLLPETDGFDGFADEREPTGVSPPRFEESTARASAEERATMLEPALRKVRDAGLVSSGILETSTSSIAVATTRGCARSHDGTAASFRVWALETAGAGGAAGYGGHMDRALPALRLAEETERAIRIAKLAKDPVSIDAGTYDVVLEPPAVTELLEWLSLIAFCAPEVERGTSPFAGRIGEAITGEAITIVENPLDPSPLGFAAPFDRERVWRRRVPLIERGIARNVLYDRAHAARAARTEAGVRSTGSAQLADVMSHSVGASALALDGGDAANSEELIAGVERGLYICRVHYVNGLLDPRRAVMTGLTRDGCFLIENGRINRPVGNVRFTDSFLEGLGRTDAMTRERLAVPTHWIDGGA